MSILSEVYHLSFWASFTISLFEWASPCHSPIWPVCVNCHAYKIELTFVKLKIEFCLETNLDFFLAQIPQRPTEGASLGISRMESLICRNSSQLELNRTIVNSGTAGGKVGAEAKFVGKIEFHRESRSVARGCLHNQSFYHRREIWSWPNMSPHLLLLGGAVHTGVNSKQWSLVGGWWVRRISPTVGGSLLASSPTVGRSQTHCTPGRANALPPGPKPYY